MAWRLDTIAGHLTGKPRSTLSCVPISSSLSSGANNTFKYTVESSSLSLEQRTFYEENGYIVIKKLVPTRKLEGYKKRFEDICKNKISVPGMTVMKDVAIDASEFVPGKKAVAKIQDFNKDGELFDYCTLPEITKYVESIIGPDIVAFHSMFVNKPPDSGVLSSRHPLHQDLHHWGLKPAELIVCSWTAMHKINRQNGCLVVIPGTHKGELLPHGYPNWQGPVNAMYHGIQDFDPNQERVYLEMEEGDTVFFHPLLIHGSGTNKSSGFRKAISCHYASGKCCLEDKLTPTSVKFFDEYVGFGKKKFGITLSVYDIFKHKSTVIKGKGWDWI